MKRKLSATLSILVLATRLAASDGEVLLPMHQEVSLELAHHVTSAYNAQGSPVFFRVAEDVLAEGQVVLRTGQVVKGTVGATKKGRSFGRSGSIDLSVRSLEAIDGSLVPLDGELEWKGRTRTGATIGGVVALGVLGGFLVKGPVGCPRKERRVHDVRGSRSTDRTGGT